MLASRWNVELEVCYAKLPQLPTSMGKDSDYVCTCIYIYIYMQRLIATDLLCDHIIIILERKDSLTHCLSSAAVWEDDTDSIHRHVVRTCMYMYMHMHLRCS